MARRKTRKATTFLISLLFILSICLPQGEHVQAAPAPDETAISSPLAPETLSAGEYHTCGLLNDGTVACWGEDGEGQASPPAGAFTQVSAGYYHTCGLKEDGTLACWGRDDYDQASPPAGVFTQVSAGYYHTCGLKDDGTVSCWGRDEYEQASPPAGTFTQVSAGEYHTCGIQSNGTVSCWGRDDDEQASPPAGTFTQVSAGYYHTCGLRSDGTLDCWGWDGFGQASHPSGTFTQVSAGRLHTCGLRSDGTLDCWGWDNYGQASPPTGIFTQVSAGYNHTCGLRGNSTLDCWGENNYGQASPPPGSFGHRRIAAGDYHTCGLLSDGTLTCWGENSLGQASPPADIFSQIDAGSGHTCGLHTNGTLACWGVNYEGQASPPTGTFTQVSAGYAHSCGLRTNGTLACWGWDDYGQTTPPPGTFIQVSTGYAHSCGLESDGTLACWGDNTYGQASPPPDSFIQVNAGDTHTCGLHTDGSIACWGANGDGQASPPTGSFTQVSAGGRHTCGLKSDGTLACWGYNVYGQASPPPGTFYQVSSGYHHTCGMKSDGTVNCWGRNNYNQAPTISFSPSNLPLIIVDEVYIQKISTTGGTSPYTFSLVEGSLPAGLNLSTDGLLWGIPTAGGTYTFTIQVLDSFYMPFSAQQEYALFVNASPQGGNGSVATIEDTPYSFSASDFPYSDADLDDFAGIQISSLPTAGDLEYAGVDITIGTICSDTTELVFTPGLNANGQPYTEFLFRVLDERGSLSSDRYSMGINVTPVNDSPTLTPIASQGAAEQTLISLTASAVDVDSQDVLTFSLLPGAPDGASINPQTGLFNWTPTEIQGPETYTVTVRVSDNGTPILSDEEAFQIILTEANMAPQLQPVGSQAGNEGTPINFSASAFDPDLPENDLTFSLLPGAPAGASINPLSGEFTWTPTETHGPATYTMTIRVNDSGAPFLGDEESFQVTVAEVNLAPQLQPVGSRGAVEGTSLAFTAFAQDPDLPENDLTFDLLPGAPDGASINPQTGEFTWTPTEAQGPGTFDVTIRVSDNGAPMLSDEETFQVTVAEANLAPQLQPVGSQSVDEETSITFTASATDPDLPENGLAFSLLPGAPAGASMNPTTGEFTWTPTEAQGPGTFDITIRVSDNGAPMLSDEQTVQVTVAEINLAPEAAGNAYGTTEDTPLLVEAPGVLGNDNDPDLPAQALSAVLVTPPNEGTLNLLPDGSFIYTPTLNFFGVASFTYAVSDGELTAAAEVLIAVSPLNDPPVVDAGADQTASESQLVSFSGSFSDPGKLPLPKLETIFWDFGDGTTASGTLTPVHTFAQNGTYTVTLLVADDQGGAGVDTLLVMVENAAPVLAPIDDLSSAIGETITIQAVFTDPGLLDAHQVIIDWGDGVTETFHLDAGQLALDLSHAYTQAGAFNAVLTITDDDGGSDETVFTVTVAPAAAEWKLFLPLTTHAVEVQAGSRR